MTKFINTQGIWKFRENTGNFDCSICTFLAKIQDIQIFAMKSVSHMNLAQRKFPGGLGKHRVFANRI